jgi:hypothetical protein
MHTHCPWSKRADNQDRKHGSAYPALLPDIEVRVARFMGTGLSTVRSGQALAPPSYPGVQLRRTSSLDHARLTPAIHTAFQVASAVVRNLRLIVAPVEMPPDRGFAWRRHFELSREGKHPIGLSDILGDIWKRGIPVVPIDLLPTLSFQGMACIVENRPVVLLGQKYDARGRVAFFMAHEIGHIAKGDCTPDHPVIDEDEEVIDDTEIECAADEYASHALVGREEIAAIDATSFRELANRAAEIGRKKMVDPGVLIFRWARLNNNYQMAALAVQALYLASGARRMLRKYFDTHVDIDSATAIDRMVFSIRLTRAEFEIGSLGSRIHRFISRHHLRPEEIDMIVDLGPVDRLVEYGVESLATAFLAEVPNQSQWRTLTLSTCAFPASMGEVERNCHSYVERTEWNVWRKVLHSNRRHIERLPTFSDCGIQHPSGVEGFDPMTMQKYLPLSDILFRSIGC